MSDGGQYETAAERDLEPCTATSSPGSAHRAPDSAMTPGSRAALAQGCSCSALGNAAYRAGGPSETPFIDPRCPLHIS